jgi:YidC/Oxa1 family membrane protein insertase
MKLIFDQYLIEPFFLLFSYFYFYFKDAGLTIIFLALFLKIILLPLDYLIYLQEEKIKKASHKISEATKNINDLLKKSEIISKIYQEEKINPFQSLFLQIINLPLLIAFFIAINKFLNKSHINYYFLNLINLKEPNIFLGFLALIIQLLFINFFSKENKKLSLFLIAMLSPLFFILPSGLLIYIIVTLVFTLLERKIIFAQKVQPTISSIEKNNS